MEGGGSRTLCEETNRQDRCAGGHGGQGRTGGVCAWIRPGVRAGSTCLHVRVATKRSRSRRASGAPLPCAASFHERLSEPRAEPGECRRLTQIVRRVGGGLVCEIGAGDRPLPSSLVLLTPVQAPWLHFEKCLPANPAVAANACIAALGPDGVAAVFVHTVPFCLKHTLPRRGSCPRFRPSRAVLAKRGVHRGPGSAV